MRNTALTFALLGALIGTAAASPSGARTEEAAGATPARQERYLSSDAVNALVAPHAPDVARCYVTSVDESRRGGRLELTFVIGRRGDVRSLRASAAGVPARSLRRVESCVREVVRDVEFPARRAETTAVVPYFFQKTQSPGAGPQHSCWNPKGCPG
jgi:hypothetical protein